MLKLGLLLTMGLTLVGAAAFDAPADACGCLPREVDSATGKAEDSKPASVTILVDGMTCGSCASKVTATLKKLDGIIDAKVTLDPGRAIATYVPEKLTPRRIVDVINELGFRASLPTTNEKKKKKKKKKKG